MIAFVSGTFNIYTDIGVYFEVDTVMRRVNPYPRVRVYLELHSPYISILKCEERYWRISPEIVSRIIDLFLNVSAFESGNESPPCLYVVQNSFPSSEYGISLDAYLCEVVSGN